MKCFRYSSVREGPCGVNRSKGGKSRNLDLFLKKNSAAGEWLASINTEWPRGGFGALGRGEGSSYGPRNNANA